MSEPRTELWLRDLGREAEYAVDLPDLASLERRGRALRFRRQAGVVAAALVVAATSVFLFQDRSDRTVEPAPRESIRPYPGGTMQDLKPGIYEITPSSDADDPTVLVTVPKGWNSADGPNRFIYLPGETHQRSWELSTWSVSLLALKVTAVASEECRRDLSPGNSVTGFDQTVEALRRLPGATLVGTPREDDRFGFPATQLRVTIDDAGRCDDLTAVFGSDVEDEVGVRSHTSMDIWVVDVDGTTLVVVAGMRGDAPSDAAGELADIVGSVEFVVPD